MTAHLSRPPEPPLSPPDDDPPKRMRSDDAEDVQDALWDALLAANALYRASLAQRVAWNVGEPLDVFARPERE